MSRWGQIVNRSDGRVLVPSVRWCASFVCKLRGLMFRRALTPGEGLLLVESRASRSATAIHMFFVPFSIAVVWLDADFQIVDVTTALPWRPFYAPARPAQYTLEAAPALVQDVSIGDALEFRDVERAR